MSALKIEISGQETGTTYVPEGNNYDTKDMPAGRFRSEIGFDGLTTGRLEPVANLTDYFYEKTGNLLEQTDSRQILLSHTISMNSKKIGSS